MLACNQLCLFFAVKKWIRHKLPVQLPVPHNDLNQEEISALAQVCAAEDHLPHHEHSMCAVATSCSAAIRWFVPRVTTCVPDQRKNR